MARGQASKRPQGVRRDTVAELARVVTWVQESRSFDETCQRMLEGACELTGAEWGAVALDEGTGLGILNYCYNLVHHNGAEPTGKCPALKAGSFTGLPPDVLEMPTLELAIVDGAAEMGRLILGRTTDFDTDERGLARLVAKQFGIAVRNEVQRGGLRKSVQRSDAERMRMRAVISNLPDGVVSVDAQTGIVEANDAARAMFGWEHEGEGENVWVFESRLCGPDGRPLSHGEVPISRALRGEWVTGEALCVARPGASLLPVLCSAKPMRDESGAITGALGHFQDMSDVQDARERIQELSAERAELLGVAARQLESLRLLLDATPVGMMMIQGSDARTLVFNKELAKLIGLEPGDRRHQVQFSEISFRKPDGRILSPDERPMLRALRTGETVRSEEMFLQRTDGTLMPVLLHAAPICGVDGDVIGAVGVAEDRTRLVELERQRSDFVSMLSHEMKNPLTIIKGVASAIRRQRKVLPDEEVTELLELMEQQSDRLTDLLDNLTNITRLEAGTFSIHKAPLRIANVVDDVCTQFQMVTSTHVVQVDVPDEFPAVVADEPRVGQVLLNLLGNAAKFSEPGSVIAVGVESADGAVTVSVRDHGAGIAAEDMPRLFQKFSRLDKSGKPGNGLGLVICKGIVEAHGGSIWVESDGPGTGATFSFSLPA